MSPVSAGRGQACAPRGSGGGVPAWDCTRVCRCVPVCSSCTCACYSHLGSVCVDLSVGVRAGVGQKDTAASRVYQVPTCVLLLTPEARAPSSLPDPPQNLSVSVFFQNSTGRGTSAPGTGTWSLQPHSVPTALCVCVCVCVSSTSTGVCSQHKPCRPVHTHEYTLVPCVPMHTDLHILTHMCAHSTRILCLKP